MKRKLNLKLFKLLLETDEVIQIMEHKVQQD